MAPDIIERWKASAW